MGFMNKIWNFQKLGERSKFDVKCIQKDIICYKRFFRPTISFLKTSAKESI